jgi:hypothetical protein
MAGIFQPPFVFINTQISVTYFNLVNKIEYFEW